MTKPQKALLIFLNFTLASAVWALAKDRDEDEFENFEDELLALSQVGEQITVNQFSIKSFRCQEKLSIVETDAKTKLTQRHEFSHPYVVARKPDRRVNEKLIFSESRPEEPEGSTPGWAPFPLIELPFTGLWTQAFSFENRLANDFKKQPSENDRWEELSGVRLRDSARNHRSEIFSVRASRETSAARAGLDRCQIASTRSADGPPDKAAERMQVLRVPD